MDKEKQIEEIAINICKGCKPRTKCENTNCTMSNIVAEYLYNAGYRKINDNKIVISKEEYEKITKELVTEQRAKEIAQEFFGVVRKETAREILELLVPDCKSCDENWHNGCLCLRATLAEKIAKQYGV